MNISSPLIILLLLITLSASKSQSSYEFGLLPSVNVSKKLKNDWKLNGKAEFRELLKEGFFAEENELKLEHLQSDISLLAARKTGLGNSLAGGYLIRIRPDEIIHRLIQQFTVLSKPLGIKTAHRFSTDQTFVENEKTRYRLRYRIAMQFPFRGQETDPGEFYLKLNNEYLQILQGRSYDLELRLVPFLGYQFNSSNKLELGLDYRINSFLNDSSESQFWTSINWYLTL